MVLLNVVSEGVLFDATITVPDLYRVLREGQRLPALIELLEVGGETGVDVTMNYVIKDFDGNTRYTESETFYVNGAKSYSKRFSTLGLEPGDYVLGVELIYVGGFAGITNPKQTWVAFLNFLIALIGSIIFEYQAVVGYSTYSIYHRTFWGNQLLALDFLIALYFCTKTVRGMIVK
jgi:hypothetical protein